MVIVVENQEEYFEEYKDKLYKLVLHCKNDVDFYDKNWTFQIPSYDEFSYEFFTKEIPVLEKATVREDSEQFLDKNILVDKLSLDSTSGTEGKPIICYRSKKERVMCSKSLWKLRRRFVKDLRPSDRFARFYAFRNKDMQVITNEVLFKDNDILLPLFDLSDEKLIHYWNEIVKFEPRWLHGPSSTIYNLALVIKKYNLEHFALEFIELSGEYVQEQHKAVIQEVFQCNTADQYGCREYWPMAYSELDGKLSVVTETIYIEQVYNHEHECNEILITLLKNDAWPLVRYRIEDLGDYEFVNSKIHLTMRRGRKADFFVLGHNRRFNAVVFSGLARAICELYGMNSILQFQIVKESDYDLKVKLRINSLADSEEVKLRYQQELQKIVGEDINIVVIETEYIEPDAKTGKTKEFIENK